MDRRNHRAAADYVRRHCIASALLPAAVGASPEAIARLAKAGVAPQPTYRVTPTAVVSAIGQIGEIAPGEGAEDYFGIAVGPWLRRALVLAEQGEGSGLEAALLDWLAGDLVAALDARAEDALAWGWAHLTRGGRFDRGAAREEVASHWHGWMVGGWAVCLRRFDGHHLATKEIERRRIAHLTAGGDALSANGRLALLDAMSRLDSVLLPFAPHERPTGTPGLFIDEPVRRFGLPWPSFEGLAA
ncbi:MAG TPA: DUF6058 family natural product biosynthesis protein [Phenylobacterium sp.]